MKWWPKEHDHFGDVDDFSDLAKAQNATDPTQARAYIEQLLAVAADDAKNVVLLATVAIGAAVILVKDLGDDVAHFKPEWRWAAVGAMGMLVLAGALLYWYSAKINYRRMTLARCLASNDAKKAREIWADPVHGIQAERGILLWGGMALLCVGASAAFIVAGHAL